DESRCVEQPTGFEQEAEKRRTESDRERTAAEIGCSSFAAGLGNQQSVCQKIQIICTDLGVFFLPNLLSLRRATRLHGRQAAGRAEFIRALPRQENLHEAEQKIHALRIL
ncbi:MAG: hypothetical protein K2F92_07870, partial [Alistipes sp.]|nr:hypothetical protein [Alistipes sp.]